MQKLNNPESRNQSRSLSPVDENGDAVDDGEMSHVDRMKVIAANNARSRTISGSTSLGSTESLSSNDQGGIVPDSTGLRRAYSAESTERYASQMKKYESGMNSTYSGSPNKVSNSPSKLERPKSVRDMVGKWGNGNLDADLGSKRSSFRFPTDRSDMSEQPSLTESSVFSEDGSKARRKSTTSERYQSYIKEKNIRRNEKEGNLQLTTSASVRSMVVKWGEGPSDTAKSLAIKQRNLEKDQAIGKLERRYSTF